MSVKQRPNGKWRARYRDEAGREYARHFPTKREALAWEAEKRSSVARGTHLAPAGGRKTLRAYAEETYLPRLDLTSNTARLYGYALNRCTFADVPLGKITREHVQEWVTELRIGEEPLKPSTIRVTVGKISAVITAAVTDRLIPFNPTRGVVLPKVHKETLKLRIPSVDAVRTMLDRLEDPYQLALSAAAFAGLRAGEILGLQPQDLVGPSTIRVCRRIDASNCKLPPTAPKHGSFREATAPAELVRLLWVQADRVGAGPEDWIFPGQVRRYPMSYTSLFKAMRRATEDWADDMRHPHALRHFYASALIAAKCDVVTVSKSLGHAQPSLTLDVYAHLWETSRDEVRAATSSLMGRALPPVVG